MAKDKILILTDDYAEDLELLYPYYRMIEAGFDVFIVGTGSQKTYKGKFGIPANAAVNAEAIKTEEFDAVIIPGGYAPDKMRINPDMIRIVREMYTSGKVIAAICHAGWVLITAGVVKDKNATGCIMIKDDLVNAGATYLDQEVVVDGNLITSRMPDDLPAFCREILKKLGL